MSRMQGVCVLGGWVNGAILLTSSDATTGSQQKNACCCYGSTLLYSSQSLLLPCAFTFTFLFQEQLHFCSVTEQGGMAPFLFACFVLLSQKNYLQVVFKEFHTSLSFTLDLSMDLSKFYDFWLEIWPYLIHEIDLYACSNVSFFLDCETKMGTTRSPLIFQVIQ